MKKINILKTLVILIIVSLAFTVSKADTQPEVDMNKPIILTTKILNEAQRWELYDYHESDDLLVRENGYEIYLNQTSPIRDTIYVLIF